jgi:hypothetical protein
MVSCIQLIILLNGDRGLRGIFASIPLITTNNKNNYNTTTIFIEIVSIEYRD